jgi:hypothetical protein
MAIPSAPITRPFADSYLLDYSNEHVFYEVDHFFWLADLLDRSSLIINPTSPFGTPSITVTGSAPEDLKRVNNILIEGFAIHLRNVIDFLYTKPQPTDVVAEDFFPLGDWDKIRPPISTTLEAARIRANKEIAHLTTDRMAGSPPAKRWDCKGLANEIRPLLQLMSSKALSTRLGPNVAKAIR